jgi:TPP-dependent indolepyruvate ferredoxin oxidoreductase alpha subunit
MAVGALALDEAVGQEHALFGVVELLDALGLDEAVGAQVAVDVLRQLVVLGRVGRVPVVEGDV